MMNRENVILSSFLKLRQYCEKEGFKGWDPYDGLNSKVFQMVPFLKKSALCRLVVIQGFKRSSINLRRIMMVPKEYNAKGIALLLSGYCNLYNAIKNELNINLTKSECLNKIIYLSELLISLRSEGYSGMCWGYNFDWQSRKLFLFPKNTPTVVATSFAIEALRESYLITGDNKYLEAILSSADFVLKDLHRTAGKEGFLFSYSPLKGNDTVYNASLLGSRILLRCGEFSLQDRERYFNIAKESVKACCAAQNKDGSWVYGELPTQKWVDSFHTGYNLDVLNVYAKLTNDNSFYANIERGKDYYLNTFFLDNGTPKYYNDRIYPIDIHSAGQLSITLHNGGIYNEHRDLAEKVLLWTIKNMQNKKEGYFYYQIKKNSTSTIPYMRWSQAFMFYSLSVHLINEFK